MKSSFGVASSLRLGLLLLLAISTVAAGASNITYTVDRTAGIGTVTGFITTDGTTGVLTTANIVNWSLFLNDGTSTYTLNGPTSGNNSSVYSSGSDVTATATQLLFNFSGTDNGFFLFQYGVGIHDGQHYYCDAIIFSICQNGESIVPGMYPAGGFNTALSGDVVIGTVPEPGSLALLGSGMLAALGAFRRQLTF